MSKKEHKMQVPVAYAQAGQEALMTALLKDPQYSLEPDPTGKLKLSSTEKRFIQAYSEYRSIPVACIVAGITEEEGREIYFDPRCSDERQRLNRVRNYRRFSKRLLSLDEIGGYLTSLLIDEDIAEGDLLSSKDKLQVTKQIMDIHKLKAEALTNPRVIENIDFSDKDVEDLTPEELRRLIDETKKGRVDIDAKKQELITKINSDQLLDSTDLDYLWSCSVEELEKLLNDYNKIQETPQPEPEPAQQEPVEAAKEENSDED